MLARAAARLNAQSGHANLPALIFLTDDERTPDPLAAIAALPRGSLVIVRAREDARRRALGIAAARLAQCRGQMLCVAGDARLAAELSADGLHLPESEIAKAGRYRAARKSWLVTCAAHSARAVLRAHLAGAHAVLLSPAFATKSHAGRAAIGLVRLRLIARSSPIPVYALGGIDSDNISQLRDLPLAGIAAIGGLLPDKSSP
jgi:thiamine-phosphate pyrophosphorylase